MVDEENKNKLIVAMLCVVSCVAINQAFEIRKRLYPLGTIFNTFIRPAITQIFTSEGFQRLRWLLAGLRERPWLKASRPIIKMYISVDDPSSFVLLQTADSFLRRWLFDLKIVVLPPRTVPPSEETCSKVSDSSPSSTDAAVVRAKYQEWAFRDASVFASLYHMRSPFKSPIPHNLAVTTIDGRCRLFDIVSFLVLRDIKVHETEHNGGRSHESSSQGEIYLQVLYRLRHIWGDFPIDETDVSAWLKEKGAEAVGERERTANSVTIPSSSSSPWFERVMTENAARFVKETYTDTPGVLEFEGEWYPPSRLHHLERRLKAETIEFDRELDLVYRSTGEVEQSALENLAKRRNAQCKNNNESSGSIGMNVDSELPAVGRPYRGAALSTDFPPVEFFYSFRSPYSQLAVNRLRLICTKYGARLQLRPVLPMVLRGLHDEINPRKSAYFGSDCGREARFLGKPIRFGKICDPIRPSGKPVERLFRVYTLAAELGKGIEFIDAFAGAAWGDGADMGTDSDLQAVCKKAGIRWEDAKERLYPNAIAETGSSLSGVMDEADSAWRETAGANLAILEAHGLWGVPCIRYGSVMVWGQDKVWVIESLLLDDYYSLTGMGMPSSQPGSDAGQDNNLGANPIQVQELAGVSADEEKLERTMLTYRRRVRASIIEHYSCVPQKGGLS